jgi:5-hydroxyisourate hydrolase
MSITTHALDTSRGRPASGLLVTLEKLESKDLWRELARGTTDADGRAKDLLPAEAPLEAGTYRLNFDTGAYFRAQSVQGFYPSVSVVFEVKDAQSRYHVPLLLNPFGYSTYRGS